MKHFWETKIKLRERKKFENSILYTLNVPLCGGERKIKTLFLFFSGIFNLKSSLEFGPPISTGLYKRAKIITRVILAY